MSEKNDQFFWGTLFLGNFIFFGTFKDISYSYRKSVFFKDIYSILDPQEILIDASTGTLGPSFFGIRIVSQALAEALFLNRNLKDLFLNHCEIGFPGAEAGNPRPEWGGLGHFPRV